MARSTLTLAAYGVTSILFGLGALAVTAWAWIYVYLPLIGAALGQGMLGALAVIVFVGPVLAGAIVAVGTAAATLANQHTGRSRKISTDIHETEGGEPI